MKIVVHFCAAAEKLQAKKQLKSEPLLQVTQVPLSKNKITRIFSATLICSTVQHIPI